MKRKNGIQGDMLGTSKETKKDLILKMEREQSERWKENNSGHYTESKAIQDLRNEGIANHTKCDGRSDKTEKSLWVVQLECTYKVHNKGISGNASLETVPLKKN